ncbi:MAG TPA: hypothetical protein VFM80_00705 [Gracilimonas sp.]|uniref:hypothetical protein n=1 Tax=Gracilimonas sp. TaxID=1974203 RepID=UPI002D92D087|nr:hypothetical protein [Gracilimonas sp.]
MEHTTARSLVLLGTKAGLKAACSVYSELVNFRATDSKIANRSSLIVNQLPAPKVVILSVVVDVGSKSLPRIPTFSGQI